MLEICRGWKSMEGREIIQPNELRKGPWEMRQFKQNDHMHWVTWTLQIHSAPSARVKSTPPTGVSWKGAQSHPFRLTSTHSPAATTDLSLTELISWYLLSLILPSDARSPRCRGHPHLLGSSTHKTPLAPFSFLPSNPLLSPLEFGFYHEQNLPCPPTVF